jgi:hypothetical protein
MTYVNPSTHLKGCWWVLSPTRKETSYSDRRFWVSCILFIIIIGRILVLFMYITRLASNDIFSPSNKIHREVGRAKDLSAPLYMPACLSLSLYLIITTTKVNKSSVSLICLPSSMSYDMLCCQLCFYFSTYFAENTFCKHGVRATCSAASSASAHTSHRTYLVTMAPRAICSV